MLKSFFAFFKRLQWKLTLSYAVVTVGTVIVLSGLMVAIVLFTENQAGTRVFNSFYWSKTAFQDNIPFLMADRAALQDWLERVQAQGFDWKDFQSHLDSGSLDNANTLVTRTRPIYVLDADLRLVAAAPLASPEAIGKPFNPRQPDGPGLESIIEAAQRGDKDYYAQSFTQPDGSTIAAFPLRKSDDEPVVAYVIYSLKPVAFALPSNFSTYATFFVITLVIMLVVSLPVGSVFGWLASRGLRTRLVGLSAAAKAWSKGDFADAPHDISSDEIGELTRDLNSMAEQLRALLHTRDELVRVEERNRLARDLHDTVKQQTYAARMQLSAARNLLDAEPAAAAEHIDTALQLNRETQQELKLIIDELRPAALQGKGLAHALSEYTARWEQHTGIHVETLVSGERPLPLDVEQVLYRVLQEALSNVARHAEAEAVQVTLEMAPAAVTLRIADNGRGFLPEAVSPHSLGLAGMQQRLGEIHGNLTVESTLAVGTKITAVVAVE